MNLALIRKQHELNRVWPFELEWLGGEQPCICGDAFGFYFCAAEKHECFCFDCLANS